MTSGLPLRWTRIIVLFILSFLGIAAGAIGVQMFQKHSQAVTAANKNVPTGVKVAINYSDVQAAVIILFASSSIVTFVASNSAMGILQDMYNFMPPALARRLNPTGSKTLSTSTLGYQAAGLAFTTIISFIPTVVLTSLVFTRQAKVTVTQNGTTVQCPTVGTLNQYCVQVVYEKTSYIRINAEFPWSMVLFGVIGTLVTVVAWFNARHYRRLTQIEIN